ncbi:PAS domain S-box protein [Janibacter sp. GS2]|uniref:two-component system sensor histidine kinase NtrB n=1 Tax=Janibacter sp. GS2 TaxID=3442646 RepID=UPI003EBC8E08
MFPSGKDFEQIMLHTESGVLIHEAASKNILWANPAACRMFGFTLDELRPLKAHHMSAQEEQYRRSVGVAWLADAVTHGTSRREWKYRGRDGREFLTDAIATRLELEGGVVVMVQFRSIDAEVEVHEELERTAGYLQRIMSHASVGIVLLDQENRIVDTSPYAARLFGLPAERALGQLLSDVVVVVPTLRGQGVQDALATHAGQTYLRMRPRGGSQRWLSGHLEEVAHDGIESRMLVVRDITARVELEREATRRDAEVHRLSRQNAMGDLAMIIAHELGQPLAATNNFLRGAMARMDSRAVDEGELRYGLDNAAKQLTRAAQIVASVKRYVQRTESAGTAADLTDVVRETLYFAGLSAAEHGVTLVEDLSAEPLGVFGEPVLLGQVVLNLCGNAIEEASSLGPERSRVRVVTYRDGDHACCSVTDQGRGLVLPRDGLAGPGFGTKPDGAGIGLMLCERIVERHGGELVFDTHGPDATDGSRRGTRAEVRIPLVASDPALYEQ